MHTFKSSLGYVVRIPIKKNLRCNSCKKNYFDVIDIQNIPCGNWHIKQTLNLM